LRRPRGIVDMGVFIAATQNDGLPPRRQSPIRDAGATPVQFAVKGTNCQ
jgi:hypothetical protein